MLVFSVLCIWGIIIHRVWLSTTEEKVQKEPAMSVNHIQNKDIPKIYTGATRLLLNYPDPFTGVIARIDTPKANVAVKIIKRSVPDTLKRLNPIQQMHYLGYVANSKGNRKVAIISFLGNEKMMQEGDTLKQIQLLAIKRGGVTVKYHGKISLIKVD